MDLLRSYRSKERRRPLEPASDARDDEVGREVRAAMNTLRDVQQAVQLLLIDTDRNAEGSHIAPESPRQPRLEVNLVPGPSEVEIAAADDVSDRHPVDPTAGAEDQSLEKGQEIGRSDPARVGVGNSP